MVLVLPLPPRSTSRRWRQRGVAALLPFMGGPVLAQSGPPASLPEVRPSAPTQLEAVVVTAQKRKEPLQSVPLSVTALSEAGLERLGVESVSDLARAVPGLNVVSAGPGANVLIIRGVSSVAGSAGTVGYYLDDTPMSASSNAAQLANRGLGDPAVFDIASVEVLRGPQGTLYGSSSMGGTVKYVTRQPDLKDVEAKASLSLSGTSGGGLNGMARAMLNLPLAADVAALRLSAFYRRQDGFIDRYPIASNDAKGIEPGVEPRRRVNTEDTQGARLQLRLELPGRWTLTPSLFHQRTELGAPYQIDVPPGSLDRLIQTRLADEPSTQRSTVANLSIRKAMDQWELVSFTSHFRRSVQLAEDTSKVLYTFFGPHTASPLQTWMFPSVMTGRYDNKEFTQELRAVSSLDGPWQVIAGAFYHDVKAPLASGIPTPAGYEQAFGPIGATAFYSGARQATRTEKAAFGELSFQATPQLSLRAGLRAFHMAQTFAQQGDGLLNGGPSAVVGQSSDRGFNPKYSLSWQFHPDHLLYATLSKGYRSGGPNNPAPASACGAEVASLGLGAEALTQYKPDTLWNHELGSKNSWLNQRLQVNASIYYIDWQRVQQQIVLQCGFNITANFGSATSKGAELEISVRPLRALTLSAGAGYTQARLDNDVLGTAAKKGDTLLNVPRWTGNASAEVAFTWWGGLPGFARVDYSFTGRANSLYDRSSPFHRRAAFAITNLKLGLESGEHWRATVFLDNLFNKIGQTDLPTAISADLSDTRRYAVTRPRTMGVTVGYQY